MLYRAEVIETIQVRKVYWVEASSVEEAHEKAETGETEREKAMNEASVTSRQVLGMAREHGSAIGG